MIWFISDTHFQHSNNLKYSNRLKFCNSYEKNIILNGSEEEQKKLIISKESIQKHDEYLIKKWNETVKEDDTIYFLGDFAFYNTKNSEKRGEGLNKKPKEILEQLKGRKIFVLGNHDHRGNKLKSYNHRIVIYIAKMFVNLIHDPAHASLDYELNLHGHVHCFDDQTEILTNSGWKNYETLSKDDKIISLDIQNNRLIENICNEKIINNYKGELINYKGKYDFSVTPNHRMYIKKYRSKEWETTDIKNILKYKNRNFEIPISGYINRAGLKLTDDEIRMCIQICSDGSIQYKNRNHPIIRFKLSKPRKIKHLKKLLDKLNIKYSINICKQEKYQNLTPYYINLLPPYPYFINKYFSHKKQLPYEFRNLSKEQVHIMLDEYAITDGTLYNNRNYQISTSKKEEADLIQEICIVNGCSCTIHNRAFKNKQNNYVLNVIKDRTKLYLNSKNLIKSEYKGIVWCVNVPYDTIISRKNGKVIISHNSAWKVKVIERDNKKSLFVNVGVDQWQYKPVSWNKIFQIYTQWKNGTNVEELYN